MNLDERQVLNAYIQHATADLVAAINEVRDSVDSLREDLKEDPAPEDDPRQSEIDYETVAANCRTMIGHLFKDPRFHPYPGTSREDHKAPCSFKGERSYYAERVTTLELCRGEPVTVYEITDEPTENYCECGRAKEADDFSTIAWAEYEDDAKKIVAALRVLQELDHWTNADELERDEAQLVRDLQRIATEAR